MTMGKKKIRPWRISRVTGEFIDPDTENQYLISEFRIVSTRVRTITFILGLLFLSFVIPDWFVMGPGVSFLVVSAIRGAAFVFMVVMGILVDKSPSVPVFIRMVTAAELVSAAVFIAMFALYPQADFLIQAFGLMLMLSVFYLVPNRFANHVAVSLLTVAAFLNTAVFTIPDVPTMHILAGAIHLILISVASAVTFSRTSYHKRRQFMHNLRLRQLAATDTLTRAYNRNKFNEELWREINRYRRTQAPLSITLMDLDDFKTINDRFGHLQGDRVLVQFARAIRHEIRVTDVFARWGGEEFALLLPATTSAQAGELAQRLLRVTNLLHLESPVLHDPSQVERVPVHCSFGITEMRPDDTIETLVQRADRMLYLAKEAGRNRIVCEETMLLYTPADEDAPSGSQSPPADP